MIYRQKKTIYTIILALVVLAGVLECGQIARAEIKSTLPVGLIRNTIERGILPVYRITSDDGKTTIRFEDSKGRVVKYLEGGGFDYKDPNTPGRVDPSRAIKTGALADQEESSGPNFIARLFGWILSPIIWLEGVIIANLTSILLKLMSYNNFVVSDAVQKGWTLVRDVANLFFVIILLIIAIGTILHLESYSFKRLLPKVLIMAVLVNFSLTICGLLIDFAQVIMMTFVATYAGTIGESNLISVLNITDILFSSGDKISDMTSWTLVGTIVLAVLMLLIAIVVILVMLAVILMRIIMLWLLVVLSPLAYIMAAFPQGQRYAQQWWQEFSKYVIIGPVLAFFLWLTFTLVVPGQHKLDSDKLLGVEKELKPTLIQESGGKTVVAYLPESERTPLSNDVLTGIGGTASMLSFIIAIGMLMGSLMITQQMGVAGGQLAGAAFGKIRQAGLKGLMAPLAPLKLGWKGAKAARDLGLEVLGAKTGIEFRPSKWKEGWETSRKKHREEREARMYKKAAGREGLVGRFATPGQALTDYWRLTGEGSLFKRVGREGIAGGKFLETVDKRDEVAQAKARAELALEKGDLIGAGKEDLIGQRFKEERERIAQEVHAERTSGKDNEYNYKEQQVTFEDEEGKIKTKRERVSIDEWMDRTGEMWEARNGIKAWDHTTSMEVNEAGISEEEKLRRQAKVEFLENWEKGFVDSQLAEKGPKVKAQVEKEIEELEKTPEGSRILVERGQAVRQREVEELEAKAKALAEGDWSDRQKQHRESLLSEKRLQADKLSESLKTVAPDTNDAKRMQRLLAQIRDEIKDLERPTPNDQEREQNKKINQKENEKYNRQTVDLKAILAGGVKSKFELQTDLDKLNKELDDLNKEIARNRPAVNYELRQKQRLAINEEKKDMTTDSWQELVSIFQDAKNNGDVSRMGAAMHRLAETYNENELFNIYGYRSDAKGMKDFTYQVLVGKKGLSKERARELGYSDLEYDRDFQTGGMSEEQALALANDVSHIGEDKMHWQIARAVGVKDGRQYFQPEEDRLVEVMAETRKMDFETYLRRANRLSFGYEVPEGDTPAERASNFQRTGERDFFNSPYGLAFLRENWPKFAQNLGRGRFNINWAINLTSKTGLPEVQDMINSMAPEERKVAGLLFDNVWAQIQDYAGKQQIKGGPFVDLLDLYSKMEAGKFGARTRRE